MFSKKNLLNGRFINILSLNFYLFNEGKKLIILGKVIISIKINNWSRMNWIVFLYILLVVIFEGVIFCR